MNEPKSTVLIVQIRNGEKAFTLGKLGIDQLGPYDILCNQDSNQSRIDTSLEVFRGGILYDRGEIREFGTHAPAHLFHGLHTVCPSAHRIREIPSFLSGNIEARWFEDGDEIRLPTPHKKTRASILWAWRRSLGRTPEFSDRIQDAEVVRGHLFSRWCEKHPHGEDGHDKRFRIAFARIKREAYAGLAIEMGKVPLPPIIHWRPM